jgi:pilus assembly protein CpaC
MTILMNALETRGLVKTLAEPNLVTMSGDTANFLAGGEFPIPIASSAASGTGGVPTVTVDFKQFGVGLAFTPTILQDGLINLVVNPEVSAIDPTISVNSGLINIPGLKVRRAHTTVELRDGESFTIAGLLQDDYHNDIRQFPWLGEIPVLGALFRSTDFQRDETELVIVVTPHLVIPHKGSAATPADHFVPPSDIELFLLGAQRGSNDSLSPEDRALISADPKGGVDGPHGHVLY